MHLSRVKKSSNPKVFIRFCILNFIANISLYALSRPKLNFGSYSDQWIYFLILKTKEVWLLQDGNFDVWQVTYSVPGIFLFHFYFCTWNVLKHNFWVLCMLNSPLEAKVFNIYSYQKYRLIKETPKLKIFQDVEWNVRTRNSQPRSFTGSFPR